MSDRSFIRFGGLAGILLALTSWAAVVAYYTVAEGGTNVVGVQVFQFFYFLIALWALFGIVAVYWVIRAQGEAWSFFATLVGAIASVGTMTSALYQIAYTRALLAVPPNVAKDLPAAVSGADPLGLATFGLTGLWFLIANILFWRARWPRLLVLLGFVAAADLFFGFVASLGSAGAAVTYAGLIAGAVGGPIYWLWMGLRLRRLA